ncbi:hypothetical protein [Streptomyces sp. NPDC046821]|uniref:hypothetical protein n=1 Tax=Streptomyces sp. NPDC046821 TaxID=3154702 RepID=UPI0033F9192D
MPRTTPPRPVDVEALFAELGPLRRSATRLHPRRGTPTVRDSSVGGPMLWPAGEPWPVCTTAHKRAGGYRHLPDTDPVPLLAVAQLYRRDVPGLPFPEQGDVLQVFWCGFERHGESRHEPYVELRWRWAADVTKAAPGQQPVPEVVGREELVPSACVLHPEVVTEHPWFEELDPGLQERIECWEEGIEEEEEDGDGEIYVTDLSTAPGWKVGGYIAWNLTGPADPRCADCGAGLVPLLTAAATEWDPGTTSWIPDEDRPDRVVRGANTPTGVSPGRGRLIVAVCPRDPDHPHRLISQ